jgi:hypothetical protein
MGRPKNHSRMALIKLQIKKLIDVIMPKPLSDNHH